ncbi:MAG: hypothetical protein BWX93_00185 [Bacteroidetes bacterium ADurb.Bin139]|nr:MAG: hypothetical protein BWX93_00185 [Bacteroidetes bacterium ADurb.Bin139]
MENWIAIFEVVWNFFKTLAEILFNAFGICF